jgi:fructoselysine-6-P-deglycase FrlB-like protein
MTTNTIRRDDRMDQAENEGQMLTEILNQPDAWVDTIGIVEAKSGQLLELIKDVDEVVFTGCGSGLNAAITIAPTFQHYTGIKAQAVPAAEIVFFPEPLSCGADFAVGFNYRNSTRV